MTRTDARTVFGPPDQVILVAVVMGTEASIARTLETLKERDLVRYYGRSEDLAAHVRQDRPGVAVYQLNEAGLRKLLGEKPARPEAVAVEKAEKVRGPQL